MINLYKLTETLQKGISHKDMPEWEQNGTWYPISKYKNKVNDIEIYTNIFKPTEGVPLYITLRGSFPNEKREWEQFLEENQWKLFPILKHLFCTFIKYPDEYYYSYTNHGNTLNITLIEW